MSRKFDYDEKGDLFAYLIVSFGALILSLLIKSLINKINWFNLIDINKIIYI